LAHGLQSVQETSLQLKICPPEGDGKHKYWVQGKESSDKEDDGRKSLKTKN